MNQKTLTSIFLFGLILSISCSTESALEQLKTSEFADNFVGQQIVDTVLIQQQSGGSADVVVRLLNGLVFDLQKQQKQHDSEHSAKNKQWVRQLFYYAYQVRKLTKQISLYNRMITMYQKRIRLTLFRIKQVKTQIRLVTGKRAGLISARRIDHQAFVKRSTRQSEMLKAVNYIIGELNVALKNGNYVQLDNIKQELMKLNKENPLQALVQLTMTFNPQSVKFAISKLSEIRDGLSASITDDVAGEKEARQQFRSLLSQLNRFLVKARRELARWLRILRRFQIFLRRYQNRKATAIKQRAMFNSLIVGVKLARKTYNANYKASKAKRAEEGVTIKKVISIISVAAPASNRVEGLKFTPKQ